MKTKQTTKEVVEKGEVKKEFKLTEAFVLWKNESKNNVEYLSGRLSDEGSNVKLVGYFNARKKNPKEPDIRIYDIDSDGSQGIEVCSLWENIGKNEKRYLTGITNDKERLVAFYNNMEENPNRPYIRAYYKQD